MDSGLAQLPIKDWEAYEYELSERLGLDNNISKIIETKAKQKKKKVVFADAENLSVLKAAKVVIEEGIAEPILLGKIDKIKGLMEEYNIDLGNTKMICPFEYGTKAERNTFEKYSTHLYELRQRKGMTLTEARNLMRKRSYYGVMMVEMGDADAMIGGLTRNYPDTVRPALQILGARQGVKKVAGMHILMTKNGPLFLACLLYTSPSPRDQRGSRMPSSA